MRALEEKSLVLHLTPTTLAGEDIQLAIDLQEYDRLNKFENAVLTQLLHLGDNSIFGCELQFVDKDTYRVLADPIWNTLRDNHGFNAIARPCFVDALHKKDISREEQRPQRPFGFYPTLQIEYCRTLSRSRRS